MITLSALWACHPADSSVTDQEGDADADADSDADTDTESGLYGHSWTTWTHSATVPHSATEPPTIDCAALTNQPLSYRPLTGARGYHDVAIGADALIYGVDAFTTLLSAPYMQSGSPLVPVMGTVQGIDWLPNGDLALARDSDDSISRVNVATGGVSVIATNVGAYGVLTGPDGLLYVANYRNILRIDPATGAKTVIVAPPPRIRPRILNFSPDYSRMYFGTIGATNGNIYYVDLNKDLTAASEPQVYATGVGTGAYHDSLQVDYCGNLYVSDYSTSRLYKIDTDRNVGIYLSMNPQNQYGHGARFGNGIGGFRLDALYMPQPYNSNTVAEIVIGVPSRTWDGTPF